MISQYVANSLLRSRNVSQAEHPKACSMYELQLYAVEWLTQSMCSIIVQGLLALQSCCCALFPSVLHSTSNCNCHCETQRSLGHESICDTSHWPLCKASLIQRRGHGQRAGTGPSHVGRSIPLLISTEIGSLIGVCRHFRIDKWCARPLFVLHLQQP